MVIWMFSPALIMTGVTVILVISFVTVAPVIPLRLNATAPVKTRNMAIKVTC